jgi:prepilin-type N-terminal cleavage/methylation domain-containing protein
MDSTNKGFSFIEILVVMSVIGILTAVTLTGINASRKSARDGQRKSDLEQIRSALEMYRADNAGEYPGEASCDSSRGSGGGNCRCVDPCPRNGSDWGGNISAALEPNYLQSLPIDPINSSRYYYYYEPICSGTQNICGVSKTCSGGCCAYELGVILETTGTCYRVCSP